MLNTQNQTRKTHIKALLLLPMMVMLASFSSFGQSNGKMKQLNMKETEKLMYKLKQSGKLSNGERPAINISPEIAGKAPMHILIHQKKKYWVKETWRKKGKLGNGIVVKNNEK